MKVYLAGPIFGRSDDDCKDWRAKAAALLPGIETLDPMRRDYRGREDECVEEIVDGDIDDIIASDALLVYFDKPSVGTAMEVHFARAVLGLPVVIINASGGRLSPWLQYFSNAVVDSIDEGCDVVRRAEVGARDRWF